MKYFDSIVDNLYIDTINAHQCDGETDLHSNIEIEINHRKK